MSITRPDSDFAAPRMIRGRLVRIERARCPHCGATFARFSVNLGPGRAWNWADHDHDPPLQVDPLRLRPLTLPVPDRAAFDVGEVRVSSVFRELSGDLTPDGPLVEALERHRSGRFGALGDLANAPDLDDDVRWCPGAFPPLTRQAEAIRSGEGLVLSRHRIEHRQDGPPRWLDVVIQTTLRGGAGETLMVPARDMPAATPDDFPTTERETPSHQG